MLKLKEVLAGVSKTQADLARAVDLSPAAIAQLINHGLWPKSLDKSRLFGAVADFLYEHGANDDDIALLEEEMEPRRANAGTPATPENSQENEECEPMLMRKQVLLPATKKAFDIRRDPFDELQSADDMYVSPDIRYVRECMYQVAKHDGFLAVIGESGAGKSTLRRDLVQRLDSESAPVIVIEPYVLAMEDNDTKGKTLKSTHIAESIMAAVAPLEKAKSSPEARFAQLHKALKTSHAAGFRHVLIIEEAHSLPIPTLKQLKRLRELEAGFTKLVSIILIGQPELGTKLSPRNGDVREVVQRIEIVELEPLPVAAVEKHLEFRFGRVGKPLTEVVDASGIQALIERLSTSGRDKTSQLYPLAIGNLMIAAMNLAVHVGEPLVTADVIKGCEMNVVPITGRLPEEHPKATHLPLCTVLTPELARCLEAVNSATRALRQAGIPIEQTSVLDRRLFIREEDSLRLHRRFRNAIRGIRQTTRGMVTVHVVSLLGVDVAWTTPVKEQDQ